jgi:DNA-binding protein
MIKHQSLATLFLSFSSKKHDNFKTIMHHLKTNPEVLVEALGQAIPNCLDAANLVVYKNLAQVKRINTSTVRSRDGQLSGKISIVMRRSRDFFTRVTEHRQQRTKATLRP